MMLPLGAPELGSQMSSMMNSPKDSMLGQSFKAKPPRRATLIEMGTDTSHELKMK